MSTPGKTHPMIIVAAGAVTLLSAVGVASIMGWIPSAGSESKPQPLQIGAAPAAATPAPVTPATAEIKPAETPAPVVKEEVKVVEAPKSTSVNPVTAPAPKPVVKPAATATRAASGTIPAPTYNSTPAPVAQPVAPTPTYVANAEPQPRRICANCGSVSSITPVEKKGEGSGAGAVIGGIVGGVLGHQVGGGRGKDLATVAGAVGGAVAGNEIEKSNKRAVTYDIRVHMEDGTYRTVRYETDPGLRLGDRVRIENGRLVRG